MRTTRTSTAWWVLGVLAFVCRADGQELKIGSIDFYGLQRVSSDQVGRALTFTEGDTLATDGGQRPTFLTVSEARLSSLPGVKRARIEIVCCNQGRAAVFVGIEEYGAPVMHLRDEPTGKIRLAADVIRAHEEFMEAFIAAIQRGDSGEDHSQGHALNHDPATRAVQERFIALARRDLPQLRLVLRSSSDADERAVAAQILGYTTDKKAVVDDLVDAMSDPSAEVRNNAMRALMVFADAAPAASRSIPRIPAAPFIEFLTSPVWSDRNKASAALLALTATRDVRLLATLRKNALWSLVEMARWKSEGHAFGGFMILGRLAGYSDDTAHDIWDHGNREIVIEAAMQAGRHP